MAEFKLGRLRFVWKGTWTAATAYVKDDIIRHGGKTYVAKTAHTSAWRRAPHTARRRA